MGGSPQIDYDALAKQAGAISPAGPDYDALAQQAGAISLSPSPMDALEQQKNFSAQDLAIGALKGLGQSANDVSRLIHAVPIIGPAVIPQAGIENAERLETPTNQTQEYGATFGNALGKGALMEAGGEFLPPAWYLAVPGQAAIGAAVAPPGQRLAGAITGAAAEGLAQGIKALAPTMAETALGIGNKARAFGKTPGVAALEETHGFSPAVVHDSASQAIENNSRQLDQIYANSKIPVSMKPALDVLKNAQDTAIRQNNKDAIQAIDDIRSRLMTNAVTGKNMGILRSASDALELKRGIGEAANWNPNIQTKGTARLLRKVYAAIDGELDRVAPEGADLNQRISSLIEVRNRADIEGRNAGVVQNVAHRVAAHTGALTGALGGGYAGYRADGPEGAVIGALGGAVIPELLSSPTAQMAAARIMGKAPSIIRPVAVPLTLSALGQH